MIDVATARPYLVLSQPGGHEETVLRENLPSENILRMVIPQIHLCSSSEGYTASFIIHHANEFRF